MIAAARHGGERILARLQGLVGGPARWRVIVLLACVLGLDGADRGTVGAIAPSLITGLRISDTQVGLLVTVSLFVAAVATLPLGVLADRVNRTRLLWISILLWSGAMVAAGASTSYLMLLLSRLALGAVLATAGPTIASLVGDLFPGAERARMYGFILAGELVGSGFGYLVAGNVANLLSWRWGFWALAVPGVAVAAALRHWLPEPARGGQSHLLAGAEAIPATEEDPHPSPAASGPGDEGATVDARMRRAVERSLVEPHRELVLHDDPASMPWWTAVRYVLSLRTNVLLIVASALGYFYLSGLRTFALVYLRGRYGIGQSMGTTLLVLVGTGSLIGVVAAGRVADARVRSGHVSARIVVAAASATLAAALFVPALLVSWLAAAIGLVFVAAAALGAVNPPLDAARLDVMHSRLWGRAESVRTALRTLLEAGAPLLFGYVSDLFGAGGGFGAGYVGRGVSVGAQRGQALEETFLCMLAAVAVSAWLLFRARRTYPADVATIIASEDRAAEASAPSPGVELGA